MQTEVRVHRVAPGGLQAFVEEWREQSVPLRSAFGIEILALRPDPVRRILEPRALHARPVSLPR